MNRHPVAVRSRIGDRRRATFPLTPFNGNVPERTGIKRLPVLEQCRRGAGPKFRLRYP